MGRSFRKFAILTVIAVIFLIFVGGFVRATGSGMGCPDWPRCFGMWVPPTSVEQLPANYQEVFGAKLKGEVEFNAVKTWTEYVNRLVGVSVGIFIFITVILAYRAYFRTERKIFYICLLAFLMVAFQGWLGAKVVSSELAPGLITLHMVVAVLILALLIWAVLKSYADHPLIRGNEKKADIQFLLMMALFVTTGQIVFGTQIREGIDLAQRLLGDHNRGLWIHEVKGKVVFHAALSVIILVLHSILFKKIKGRFGSTVLRSFALWGLILVVIGIVSGSLLSLAGFPAMMQPLHLTLSVVIISIQFILYFILSPDNNNK
ncbi:MAG: COX15/CtaA family protein [Leadbetterella sp.]|nr:COX15/CtaA family protein [Leadbetterella sp.]